MSAAHTLLGDLSPEAFLAEYWQKKPLLIRNALPGFENPVSPEELAGLACEEDATARLILEKGGQSPWELHYGPFEPDTFESLPATHWTLLVQEVDRFVPAVAALLQYVRFIPNWRLDDVMVSYAPAQGTVGAHIDNYDVFLVQGLGRRRWQIDTTPVEEEVLVPDLDVSVLQLFTPDRDWILEPGDALYLPPRIAHYGVALDDCMTYSIGFRAPSHADLLEGFLTHHLAGLDPSLRYADPDLAVQAEPGEIPPAARARLHAVLHTLLADQEAFDRWFGTFITEPKRGFYALPAEAPLTPRALVEAVREGARLRPTALTQTAFIRHADGRASLFLSGEEIRLDPALAYAAPLLTGTALLDAEHLAPHLHAPDFAGLLADLVNEGWFEIVL